MMTEEADNIRDELYNHVLAAVQEGLSVVSHLIKEKEHLGTYYNWPKMSLYDSGLPQFSEEFFSYGPIKYSDAFGGFSSKVKVNELKSFLSLWEFVEDQAYIKRRLLHPNMLIEREDDPEFNEMTTNWFKLIVFGIPEDLIDRYIHIHKTFEFSKKDFDPIYIEYIASIFEEKLYIDICIPILFLKFNFDNLTFGPSFKIEKMDDSFQLARAPIQAYGPGVHKSVLSSATHMLVLEDWYILNNNRWELSETISNVSVYPKEYINNFFASLRIVTGLHTGYAQLLMRPKGWAKDYKAYLPPIYGTSIRAYPSRFENYYWNRKDIPELSSDTCQEVGSLYTKLSEVQENTVRIAIKRLNQCFLREDEEDSIIDATIGLEALLSDDDHQEMTHKLAMRVGALSKLAKDRFKKPYDVFQEVKQIYAYRSAVVHGSTTTPKKKEIKIGESRSIPAGDLAIEYLRRVLKILITEPNYRNPKEIDKELLLNDSDNGERLDLTLR
jgi:hypothetical protein